MDKEIEAKSGITSTEDRWTQESRDSKPITEAT